MQLFLNATSPFARLARVAAIEKGLIDDMELIWCDPWNNDLALLALHPMGRIPVLLTDSGHAIAESQLIVQYLDQTGTGGALVPPAQCAAVLAATSVAYGLMEAAFQLVIARKYEGAAQADASVMGQRRLAAITRALTQLETAPPAPCGGTASLNQLTTAVAVDYVRFRLPPCVSTQRYPQLNAWLDQALERESLRSTAFA